MTIQIGATYFDDYRGEIRYPRIRAISYSRSDKANAGVQVLPSTSEPFQLETWIYIAPANTLTSINTLDALIGTDVAIVTESITYATAKTVTFTVLDVVHRQEEQLVRARGERNGSIYDHSPAAVLKSLWTFQAGPT